uniref:NADH dehydrogenase subunit 2 n=2 Tax=unclassified Rhinebothrium TaxID=2685310 RepID=A0A8K1SZ98_9CEST|nr:NADH dehydrogenase subunit 2 [Rhinebothrium sp. MZUSP 8022]UFQ88884.1 NADH dehydrogenase subunit 2 [Rhinebothrium sp. MZUSP 8023]
MLAYRFHADLIFFSFFFSLLFCLFCSLVDNLLSFWVFLELCGLSIIPSFFCSGNVSLHGFYSSLLSYIVMSSLSSILIVSGILFFDLYAFILFGFLVKFGLFPFSLWVYRVFSNSNWYFIFLLSVISKFPVLFFCYLLSSGVECILFWDCGMTLLMCTTLFWVFSADWCFVWCHISLSSVSTLIVSCFCSDFFVSFFIYFYYFIWSIFCVIFFNRASVTNSSKNSFWWFSFLLLITPLSLPLFYKLSVCLAIAYSSVYLLVIWGIYSFSEQFFLYKLGSDFFYSGVFNRWCN